MPAGRPTGYSEEILEKTNTYLTECVEQNKLPSIARLARYLLVSRTTIYEWSGKHKEFSYILDDVLSEQEASALEKGLNGEWNPTIVKLLLGKHGYSEKSQTDITSGGKRIKNDWHIHPVTTSKNGED